MTWTKMIDDFPEFEEEIVLVTKAPSGLIKVRYGYLFYIEDRGIYANFDRVSEPINDVVLESYWCYSPYQKV